MSLRPTLEEERHCILKFPAGAGSSPVFFVCVVCVVCVFVVCWWWWFRKRRVCCVCVGCWWWLFVCLFVVCWRWWLRKKRACCACVWDVGGWLFVPVLLPQCCERCNKPPPPPSTTVPPSLKLTQPTNNPPLQTHTPIIMPAPCGFDKQQQVQASTPC